MEESSNFFSLKALRSADIQLALALLCSVSMMFFPLPPIALDILLSVSLAISFVILLVSLYVDDPLDISTFPTLLLLATLFRLSLNVATTRNILLDGAAGNVSQVVTAFGNFVVGGDYFVGFVVFVILVLINFLVITKGAGRVAEVGARFTLDAMPGKQMAIDSDLNAGVIDRNEAKERRVRIEEEADFYGSMDGASKFVRGDAIAGIVITVINILVGLGIGTLQYDMSFSQAAQTFTLLTVGDGLVSQIPSVIVSVATGVVVTRASTDRALSSMISDQVFLHPKALYVCSGLLGIFAVVPGLPSIPFLFMAAALAGMGRIADGKVRLREEHKQAEKMSEKARQADKAESIESMLNVDTLCLEVGVGLIPLVDKDQNGEILERIVSSRKQFAQDYGIIVPMVMVRDNVQLKPGDYQILLRGNIVARGALMPDYELAMLPSDATDPIDGIRTVEPAYGIDALWIRESQKEEATFRGYTVVNCATVVVTHLAKVLQERSAELIGRQEVQSLVDRVKERNPKVVEEVLSNEGLTLGSVVQVLRLLLEEQVSIRDLLSIFECLADHARTTKNPVVLARFVRRVLGRGIIKKYLTKEEKLLVITLDRSLEDLLISGIQRNEDGSTTLNVEPDIAQRMLNAIAEQAETFNTTGTTPILLCGAQVRWDLRKLVARFIPGMVVLAFDEVPSDVVTENVGIVEV